MTNGLQPFDFWSRFNALIVSTARRVARHYTQPTQDLCDALAQRVYLKLFDHDARSLREFFPPHEGASFVYLKTITEHVVRDYFRGKARHDTDPPPLDTPFCGQTGSEIILRELDDFLKRRVSQRDRNIFWLSYLHGMTAKEIAAIPAFNLTTKGVEAVIKRIKDLGNQFDCGDPFSG